MSAVRRIISLTAAATALLAAGAAAPASASHSVVERLSLSTSAGNGAHSAAFASASTDGSIAFFDTTEQLDPGDTDSAIDLYARTSSASSTTTLLSTGPAGGNGSDDAFFAANSHFGDRVFFHTTESLVAADTDTKFDVYERTAGGTTLISTGPTSGTAADAFLRGISDDGTKVFFETTEKLHADDLDSATDVYQRQGTTTTWLSTGPAGGNAAQPAHFRGASADGTKVFFDTAERLVSGDSDSATDIYERSGSTTTRISTGSAGGNGSSAATFDAATDDGTKVFFHTNESLEPPDSDGWSDVYQRSGSTTTRISVGTQNGNEGFHADFVGASQNGNVVVFETEESLDPADTDTSPNPHALDAYRREGGITALVTDGPSATDPNKPATALALSDDGSRVFFDTDEQIIPATDTDAKIDVYERFFVNATTGTTTQRSSGNGAHDAFFSSISAEGSRVFFETAEQVMPATDTDSTFDIYERQGAALTHISRTATGGNGNFIATFAGISQDGLAVFMHTNESLETADSDCPPPVTDQCQQDVYKATLPGYPRPGGASPLRVPLVPAFVECTSPNRLHGPPDLPGGTNPDGSCSSPTQVSTSLTVGSPDGGGGPANFVGSVKLATQPGTAGPPEDSNVSVVVSMVDVRCKAGTSPCGPANTAGGADYTGEVELVLSLRITDKWNAPAPGGGADPATGADTIRATIGCSMSASMGIGSTCSVTTDVNALTGGTVARDTTRAIWQVDRVVMNDGGPDGMVGTASGNKLFATQGVFVP